MTSSRKGNEMHHFLVYYFLSYGTTHFRPSENVGSDADITSASLDKISNLVMYFTKIFNFLTLSINNHTFNKQLGWVEAGVKPQLHTLNLNN